MGLLPGGHTPRLQETMVRLGSKLPFVEAAEEVWRNRRTQVAATTLRRVTHRSGAVAEAVVRAEVERLKREGPTTTEKPKRLALSADGTFIHLTSGEWREVKSVAVGQFEKRWQRKKAEVEVKTYDLSYFSRSYRAREFEDCALAELHRRGLENAQTVVAVNDGAEWIQSFLDYHCPRAVRIIDFSHVLEYLANAAKAIWGEGTEEGKAWFKEAAHRLKHKPPQETVANLRLLQQRAKTDEQLAEVDRALFYIQRRLEMMDYPHFQRLGYPIGSGAVESGHKVVTHRRLKGPGMRWAEAHVDGMLALRDCLASDRWDEGWQQVVVYHQQQRQARCLKRAEAHRPPPPEPLTFASLRNAGLLPAENEADSSSGQETATPKPWRPADDHPWRNNVWPTREAWRWN